MTNRDIARALTAKTIYGAADVARLLEVTRSAVANYQVRHDDTPAPAFTTPDGRPFWDAHGMALWHVWHGAMKATGPDRHTSTDERLRRAHVAVASMT